jgi:hypothetical protein
MTTQLSPEPAIRVRGLAAIDILAVREWVAALVEHGLSASRIRNAHQVLSQILAAAVEDRRIVRNPAAYLADRPRAPDDRSFALAVLPPPSTTGGIGLSVRADCYAPFAVDWRNLDLANLGSARSRRRSRVVGQLARPTGPRSYAVHQHPAQRRLDFRGSSLRT